MTIIYFITPKNVVNIGSKAAEFVPIVELAVEYIKKAKKVTHIQIL